MIIKKNQERLKYNSTIIFFFWIYYYNLFFIVFYFASAKTFISSFSYVLFYIVKKIRELRVNKLFSPFDVLFK